MSARRLSVRVTGMVAIAALAGSSAWGIQRIGKAELYAGASSLAKVSSHLMRARVLAEREMAMEEIAEAMPVLKMSDGRVKVEVRLSEASPATLAALRSRGLVVDGFHLGYGRAYGWIAPADLDEIAALAEVRAVNPMPRRGTRVGSAHNQADTTMRTDDVRSMFGHDGTGVEVGVLSDSFRDLSPGTVTGTGCMRTVMGTSSQTSGDLPTSVVSLDDGPGGGSDEARAIGELIFDIAPAADFFFHSAFNNPMDFADGITELAGCGADLIVDDVFWTGQAFFQDDIIAQAAQDAVDAGVPYFSAAGNDATFGIDEIFADSSPTDDLCSNSSGPDGDDLHDFGSGDNFAEVTVPDDCNFYAELQWAQPFDSIGTSPGSATDLDLFLLDSAVPPDSVSGANVVDSSEGLQGGASCSGTGGDPVESVFFDNTSGGDVTLFLAVDGCCPGAKMDPFRIVTLSFNCNTTSAPWDFEDGFDAGVPDPSETPIFVDPQIFGHPAAKDVIAVAATFYGEIDGGGGFSPGEVIPPPLQFDVEPFSSLGGDIPFYFDTDGTVLPSPPQTRFKPEVTGPDGTNNSFFGVDSTFDPDSDPNFFGTSAAAPNSAGIAALILDATDLKINPLPLKQLLQQSTIDMESFPSRDALSGDGFTDALPAISSLTSSTTPLIDDLEFDLDGGAFFSSPPAGGTQRLQANDTLLLQDGDFSGIDGLADELIFADGFESGDTSAWSN